MCLNSRDQIDRAANKNGDTTFAMPNLEKHRCGRNVDVASLNICPEFFFYKANKFNFWCGDVLNIGLIFFSFFFFGLIFFTLWCGYVFSIADFLGNRSCLCSNMKE